MINLTPQHQAFVDSQIATGLFREPAEVIAAGLDLLQREAADRELQATIADVQQSAEEHKQGKSQPAKQAINEIRQGLEFAP